MRVITRLNVGGPSWHVVLLTAGMRHTFPTVLATGELGPGEGDMSGLAAERGVAIYRVPGLRARLGLLHDLRALWALWRLFRRVRPRIVHTHTAKAGALGRVAAFLAGVPVRVHTFHGHVFRRYFSRVQTFVFVTVERLLARITTTVVAISPRQADELRHHLKLAPERVVVVPLGLELEHFATADGESARARFRESIGAGNAVVVTIVARLTAVKNHALALRAFARVAPRAPNLLLALVGGGEQEESLRALARELGIEGRVRFAGWWDDLEAVYYGSDVIALSSNVEGTPVCLIEALACGRPIIATDVGGVADILEDGALGLIVAPGDEQGFAAGLERFVDPAERARFAGRGRELVLGRHAVARLIGDLENLYSRLLQQRSGRSR